MITLLLMSTFAASTVPQAKPVGTTRVRTDALVNPKRAPSAKPQSIGPQGPGYYETSEYMIGSVAFSVIPLESNGTIDPDTETWNDGGVSEIGNVRTAMTSALNWWSSQNTNASVSFRGHVRPGFAWRVHQPVPISYEPITRPSTDEGLWIGQAMTYIGFPGTDYFEQVYAYLNSLRRDYGPSWGSEADWAFTVFMIDSSNDPDGCFTDGQFAYAYLGGPFIVMTYTNDGYGPQDLARTFAHEIGHIFYATDENDGITENSGYLNAADVENFNGVMYGEGAFTWNISPGTWGQVGWRDSDNDGIQDIVDTFPDTILNPYSPDPTTDSILTYTGTVSETPYPNDNPYGTGRDITINRISNVEFRVDDGPWMNASPADGTFNETDENFSFSTPNLSPGTHIIETRGINSVGNTETTYASDTIRVVGNDVAVTNVEFSKTVVGQGQNLDINATVTNQGDFVVTFEVTFSANETSIATFPDIELAIGASLNLIFTWNTTGFAYGNYTISVYASPVSGEVDVADNNLTVWTIISLVGDIAGPSGGPDGQVDMRDISYVARRFMCAPGDQFWDFNADFNGDGKIDMRDVGLVAKNFGNSYP